MSNMIPSSKPMTLSEKRSKERRLNFEAGHGKPLFKDSVAPKKKATTPISSRRPSNPDEEIVEIAGDSRGHTTTYKSGRKERWDKPKPNKKTKMSMDKMSSEKIKGKIK